MLQATAIRSVTCTLNDPSLNWSCDRSSKTEAMLTVSRPKLHQAHRLLTTRNVETAKEGEPNNSPKSHSITESGVGGSLIFELCHGQLR